MDAAAVACRLELLNMKTMNFSQSLAEFFAELRKGKTLLINFLHDSAVHQLDSARNT
jgi:hypothetical protein